MADENENSAPQAGPTSPAGDTLDFLKTKIISFGKAAFQNINAIPPPSSNPVITLPQLKESIETGYKATGRRSSVSVPVVCCRVGGFLIEKNAAYDYLLMSNAAAKAGISLPIRSGFRSMEDQQRLYNERKNPAVAKEKGVAAFPGTSNHQTGIALDIHVGLTKAQYLAGQRTAAFNWLVTFGPEFGFDHVEGAKVNEPWHWTHLKSEIRGKEAFKAATGFSVLTSGTAAAASSVQGMLQLVNRVGHDKTTSFARSMTMPQMSRGTAFKESSAFSANTSNYVAQVVGQLEAAKLTLEAIPPGFEPESVKSLSYDFNSGLWGDGATV